MHDKGRILDLVDKKLASSYDRKQALTILLLAMKCVNLSPTLRPKMSEVVSVLEGEKRIDEISEADTSSANIVLPKTVPFCDATICHLCM